MAEDKNDKASDRSDYFRATPEDFIFNGKKKPPIAIDIGEL